ncbi:MAG: hypothetical protein JWP97_3226 [Labilithrix sp.]|nr:hypothetical protein [Labilithrix sp.]
MLGKARALAMILSASVFAGVVGHAGDAWAEASESQSAAAESLFQEARKLMDAKRYGEACPKLAASHKLAPAVGTLLNLADCYERNNQLASAWVRFHEAVGLAQRLGRPDREKTARDRADKLEPRLLRLTINAKDPSVEVKLDGTALDAAALGTAVPVDPGKHTVDASAKGKKPYATSVDVSERSRSPSVDIPALEIDPDHPEKAPVVAATEEPARSPDPPRGDDGGTQRLLGGVAMGVGGVGLVLGTIYGLRTSSKWSEAQDHCTGTDCDRTGVELATSAKNAGTVSTITFIAGGVFVAGGAILFFTAPSGKKSAAQVGVGPGSIQLRGTF